MNHPYGPEARIGGSADLRELAYRSVVKSLRRAGEANARASKWPVMVGSAAFRRVPRHGS